MAIKLKSAAAAVQTVKPISLPKAQPKAATVPSWHFEVLAQDGLAGIVEATPPKGAAYYAMATLKADGTMRKLGLKIESVELAQSFSRLLAQVQ